MRPFADLPWIGIDRDGLFAVFESAGFGQIPMPVFDSLERYLLTLDSVFAARASQDTYVFDYGGIGWLDRTRPYLRIHRPDGDTGCSIDFSAVPHVIFRQLSFRDSIEIIIDDHFEHTNL